MVGCYHIGVLLQSDGEKRKELTLTPEKRKVGVEEEMKNNIGESTGKIKTTMTAGKNE